jgi:multidrug efflux pump subunit AcrB
MKEVLSDGNGRYYPFNFQIQSREKVESERLIMNGVARVSGARVDFSGSIDQTNRQNREILIIIGISIILLYFILAAQFNSVFQPIIVLLELPIDIGAGLLLLYLLGQTVNVMGLIGIVVMCGIVINDSIIKVDTVNRLRKEGYSVIHAVLVAGTRRLKPILMTSLTTILSLLPFMIFGGMGNEMQRPLAVALTGGLGVGTFVSLFFIPLAYYYVNRKKA